MISVTLYDFEKRINSTLLPTSNTRKVSLSCLIRKDSSIINPYLELSTDNNVYTYNYCYIPTFNRYYFIDDIIYSDNVWVVKCSVDVLASFKNYLSTNSQYVLRSASSYNPSIVDTRYPTSVENTYARSSLSGDVLVVGDNINIPGYFDRTIANGNFVIGVIGENTGGISYYSLTYSAFKTMINNLMAFNPSDMSDLSSGVAKELANPLQYVTSCYWFPYVPSGTQTSTIKFGRYSISAVCYLLDNSNYIKTFRQQITLPRHPQSNSLGAYLGSSLFSEYQLIFQPFGSVSLNNTDGQFHNRVNLFWTVDYTTGSAYLIVRYADDVDSFLGFSSAQYGIPIHLSQATVDYLGAGSDFIGGLGSLLGSGFNFIEQGSVGSIVSGLGGLASGIIGATSAMQPQVSTKGMQGSFLQQTTPVINATFHTIVNTNEFIFGRPLCATRDIANMRGFLQIASPQISMPRATEQEVRSVIEFMSNGFYYE